MYKILDIIDDIERELNIKLDKDIKDDIYEEYLDIEAEHKKEFKNDVLLFLQVLQNKKSNSNVK